MSINIDGDKNYFQKTTQMAKLSERGNSRGPAKESKHSNRFYTKLDMAEIKHYEAILNSMRKRGIVVPEGQNFYITLCGCGAEGCFVHGNFKSVSQEDCDKFRKLWPHNHHVKKEKPKK